jgi:hypothetical protein
MSAAYFSSADEVVLIELYSKCPRTLDDLPYTGEFSRLHEQFIARTGKAVTRHDVWRALSNLRKRSKLPRKKR